MKTIYFEYPNEYNEMFEKLVIELDYVNVTDEKRYSLKPF